MPPQERGRARAAATHARRAFPGVIGDVLYQEIMSWEEFGWRLDRSSTVRRLIEAVLATPVPEPGSKAA